ncbi:MAG: prepilin peptidase [Candidatus Aenigmarchaeota archaeon]|nr:prepilin peptidase [Candidatus Aenigmarchaeota archaeon]MDI6722357.1 prepilin peptidase [Candidatus Aenigmarchaeota archaeon]
MFELLILALLASSAAGIWDLKTTEVPDEIPALMIAAGLFYWTIHWLSTGNLMPLAFSVVLGSLILLIGLILYKKKQWGAADAWIFAAIFYMLPSFGFFAGYLINFFIVTIAYMVIYSLYIGLASKNVMNYFMDDIRTSWKYVALIPALFAAAIAGFSFAVSEFSLITSPSFAGILLIIFLMSLFWRYGVVIEKRVFRKRVSTKDLKPGDVIEGGAWKGLTKDEIKKTRVKKKYVVIKEGIRFVPVFPITLAITAAFGTIMPFVW